MHFWMLFLLNVKMSIIIFRMWAVMFYNKYTERKKYFPDFYLDWSRLKYILLIYCFILCVITTSQKKDLSLFEGSDRKNWNEIRNHNQQIPIDTG